MAVTRRMLLGLGAAMLSLTAVGADGPKPMYGAWGVDLTSLDTSVKPGDDFFLYANGTWLKKAQIPSDRTGTGSFQDLTVLSEQRMAELIEELEKKPRGELNDEERKLRDLYDAFLDTGAIEHARLD